MSRTVGEAQGWEITPVAGRAVSRDPDGRIALTLQITRHGDPVA
ncbi:hypothetical protein OIU81_12985 [Streptomyces sp. NBC_01454]|nr:hypothetical protein [Streptomyces sp. NBC_01454]